MRLTQFVGAFLALACSAGSPTKSGAIRPALDAGIQPDAALMDSGLPDSAADSGTDTDAHELDAHADSMPDAPTDAPIDAPDEGSVDSGWVPPDGAVSSGTLSTQCPQGLNDPCIGAWTMGQSGTYRMLSCHVVGNGGLIGLCTFGCLGPGGYPDPSALSDCSHAGGSCVIASEPGNLEYCAIR